MNIGTINEVEAEMKRFSKRLKALKERAKDDPYTFLGCKESGAVRRAAMDLKNELTKLTR